MNSEMNEPEDVEPPPDVCRSALGIVDSAQMGKNFTNCSKRGIDSASKPKVV
jgi:hypothetical protein